MNLRRLKAIAKKEFLHVLRDPRSLMMGIGMPMLLLFLFGYALTLDVDRVPLVVWDQAGTAQSREFVSRFSGSRYFDLRQHAGGYRDIEDAVDRRDALIALVIPTDFDRLLSRGEPATVQTILDGSDPTGAWTLEVRSSYNAGSLVSWCLAVTTTAVPEITVLDGAVDIADGQTAAIDFGNTGAGSTGPTRTFTVRNTGDATLTLGAVSVPAGFALAEGLVPSLAHGASDTFTVRLDTRVTGDKQGQISFSTNDGNENPFNLTSEIGVPGCVNNINFYTFVTG